MVHVSELDVQRTAVVADAWKEGDTMDVKIIEVLDNGNIRLSRKAVLVDDAAAQGIDLLATVAATSSDEEGAPAPATPRQERRNGRRDGQRGDRSESPGWGRRRDGRPGTGRAPRREAAPAAASDAPKSTT